MKSLESYQSYINNELVERLQRTELQQPTGLYDPCRYILQNGGKRIRASLVLLASKMFSGSSNQALPVALAFETFHNFTLIHDDIMDKAMIRRGLPTVHVKWNENTAILSGDAVMIIAYRFFEEASQFVTQLLPLLNKTALEVCEGQQYDIELEKASLGDAFVSEEMYLRMIELKTSVLLAACLKAGAIVGGANAEDAEKMYQIGRLLGIAFQIQDDVLDTYGDESTFGKRIGGDISVNKKTYLLIKALHDLPAQEKKELLQLMSRPTDDEKSKYEHVVALFNVADVKAKATAFIEKYFDQAKLLAEEISVPDSQKQELKLFMQELLKREF